MKNIDISQSTNGLIDIIQTGTEREKTLAMELLIEKNDNLVLHIINKYFPSYRHSYMEDMRQEGRIAMYEHAERFDPERGTFSTYITPYIIDAIKTYICGVHGITTHYSSQLKKCNKAIATLHQDGVDDPTFADIAEEMGIGVDAVKRVFEIANNLNHASIEGDGKDREICTPYSSSPDAILERQSTDEAVHTAVESLEDPAERAVIKAMFFSDPSGKTASLADVAKKLGMDVSTVRRLKNLALRRLEHASTLKDYSPTAQRRELAAFADTLSITFTLPDDVVSASVDLALTIGDEVGEVVESVL